MALSKRQMACFEGNRVFLDEVAAALLPIAATMLKGAIVTANTAEASAVDKAFAAARESIARQILNEQGITLAAANPYAIGNREATGGSVAMKYLVQQMLLMQTWTITPDEWVADEAAARAAITASMSALLEAMTAIPEAQA
jgi:hypothetical protein